MTEKQAKIGLMLLAGIFLLMLYNAFSGKLGIGKTYEYKLASPNDIFFDRDMKSLGDAGWKVVNARRATSGGAAQYEIIMMRER